MQMTWFCILRQKFIGVFRRRGLNFNGGKNKEILLNGDERLECEVYVDKIRLEHVLEGKCLEYVLDELGTDGTV